MRIAGLDLSMAATGVALPDGGTLTIKTNLKEGDWRLLTIRDAVADALQGCDLVVVEGWLVRSLSAPVTGMVHGAVRGFLMDEKIPYAVVTPATLKKYATGKGNADKTAMIMAAYQRSGTDFSVYGKDDNQCDAAWLRWAGLDHCGEPAFPLPAAQRAALDKVDWFAGTGEL